MKTFTITVLDETGSVLVILNGFKTRPLSEKGLMLERSVETHSSKQLGYYAPVWQEAFLKEDSLGPFITGLFIISLQRKTTKNNKTTSICFCCE